MSILSRLSNQAQGMTPGQASQVLGWVNDMLSRNLQPEERERFFTAKRELEGILESQRRREARGLLSELMRRQNPNLFQGEGLSRAPGGPPELGNHPEAIIRNVQPNPYATADRMALDPDRFDPEEIIKRLRGI